MYFLLSRQSFHRLSGGSWRQHGIHNRQRFFLDVQTVAKFLFVDDEWRANPQHIEAAECVKMVAFQVSSELGHLRAAAVERSKRLTRGLVLNELQSAEESFVTNVAHATILLLHGFEAWREIASLSFNVGKDFFFFVDLQIGYRCGATHRMAAISESAPKHVGLEIFCDGVRNNHHTERKITARETLGAGHDVGANAVMLRGEPFAGAAKSAHDFVVDQKDAVFVAEGAEFWIVIVRRNEQAV